MKFFTSLTVAALLGTMSAASAAVLLDGASLGLYNAGLGQSLDGTSAVFPIANSAGGDPVIDIPASSPPDLSAAAGALGSWLTTPASPGGTWSAAPQAIPTNWAVNSETAIIYAIDGGSTGYTNVMLDIGVDNGVFVWLNGTFLGGHLRPGGASLGEFSLNIGSLGAGTSFLQVLREDHGGGTGWAIRMTGDRVDTVIPLPATGLLLLAGLGGLAATRRRKG